MQGVISKVHSRPTAWGPMFSFQINGSQDYFGTGKTPPPDVGTMIVFDVSTNNKGYKSAENVQTIKAGAPATGVSVAGMAIPEMSKDDYWRNKEKRDIEDKAERIKRDDAKQAVIELQSCRNSAIEFVKLLITPVGNGEVGLKLPAQAKREEFLFELVNKYTSDFLAANKGPGDESQYQTQGSTPENSTDDPTIWDAN